MSQFHQNSPIPQQSPYAAVRRVTHIQVRGIFKYPQFAPDGLLNMLALVPS